MERFVNKYFIYYCLLSMKDDVVHKRKETTKERREQNERYWYIKYLKIYRNGLDRIVVMFFG